MSSRNRAGLRLTTLVLLLMPWLGAMGCGKSGGAKATADAKIFENASAATKDAWYKIVTAAGTNDYATAILSCKKLVGDPALTPEQRTVVNTTQVAIQDRMFDAAQKGDAAAAKSIEDVRKAWRY